MKKQESTTRFFILLVLSLIIFIGVGYYAHKNKQIKINPTGYKFSENTSSYVDDAPLSSENYYGTFVNPYHNYSIELPEGCSTLIYHTAAGISSTSYTICTGYGGNEGDFRIGTENLYENMTFEQNAK